MSKPLHDTKLTKATLTQLLFLNVPHLQGHKMITQNKPDAKILFISAHTATAS